jgi:hypothetical protein
MSTELRYEYLHTQSPRRANCEGEEIGNEGCWLAFLSRYVVLLMRNENDLVMVLTNCLTFGTEMKVCTYCGSMAVLQHVGEAQASSRHRLVMVEAWVGQALCWTVSSAPVAAQAREGKAACGSGPAHGVPRIPSLICETMRLVVLISVSGPYIYHLLSLTTLAGPSLEF